MSAGDAFLKDVCDHPEDDAVRLIYADYLDDNGDTERAEFIRLQVHLGLMDRPRKGINHYVRYEGGDLFSAYCNRHEALDGVYRPGDRFDVIPIAYARLSKQPRVRYVVCEKVITPPGDDSFDECQVVFRRDELSKKFSGKVNSDARVRCNALLEKNWREWLAPTVRALYDVPPRDVVDSIDYRRERVREGFVRGFLEEIRLRPEQWRHRHAGLRAASPIRVVEFNGWPRMSHGVRATRYAEGDRVPHVRYEVQLYDELPGGFATFSGEYRVAPNHPEVDLLGRCCSALYRLVWPTITFAFPDRLPDDATFPPGEPGPVS
jgi:uncharacterized protein (TIGR02996 family)